ncbi:hypothetical protein HWD99_04430 [Microbacterium sp. C5A9]|uniref:DUF7882 family protein n=1 Tax=Microbacterium sp. C5A9 TaxID=2736663 RepID=UPI001F524343|nr:hypothetical protein [Microbacterium sp. C5A9]MCI1017866.1 hypothetical protein [Microbacterium sp. C5A9]
MGSLEYNSSRPAIVIEDGTLAHLKIVIATKLRRNESFMMTWLSKPESSAGRMSIWVHPSIPLVIEFDDPQPTSIDPNRVTEMMEQLNARGELLLDQL